MSQNPVEAGRWESEIARFAMLDQRAFPPRDAVVFVGSSSIALWQNAQQDFPFIPLIRRGFGGSIIEESTFYADRIVIPYAPRLVVLYAGDNDLAQGKTPDEVLEDFQAFVKKIHDALPSTHIAFVSIKFSPARWELRNEIARANELIQNYCARHEYLSFVDITPLLLDENGEPKSELFIEDGLHPSRAGYEAWTSVIAPFLQNHLS